MQEPKPIPNKITRVFEDIHFEKFYNEDAEEKIRDVIENVNMIKRMYEFVLNSRFLVSIKGDFTGNNNNYNGNYMNIAFAESKFFFPELRLRIHRRTIKDKTKEIPGYYLIHDDTEFIYFNIFTDFKNTEVLDEALLIAKTIISQMYILVRKKEKECLGKVADNFRAHSRRTYSEKQIKENKKHAPMLEINSIDMTAEMSGTLMIKIILNEKNSNNVETALQSTYQVKFNKKTNSFKVFNETEIVQYKEEKI